MRIIQLKMILRIIIRLIVIIMDIAELIMIFTGRIVSTIDRILFQAYALPCDSCLLRTHQPCESQ